MLRSAPHELRYAASENSTPGTQGSPSLVVCVLSEADCVDVRAGMEGAACDSGKAARPSAPAWCCSMNTAIDDLAQGKPYKPKSGAEDFEADKLAVLETLRRAGPRGVSTL